MCRRDNLRHNVPITRKEIYMLQSEDRMNKSFWIALVTGLTAGSIVALLYAPQSGEETRKKIGKAYDEAGDYVEEASDYLKDQAERLTKEAQTTYKQSASQLDEAYAKASDSLTVAYNDAKDKLASLADNVVDQARIVSKKGSSLV